MGRTVPLCGTRGRCGPRRAEHEARAWLGRDLRPGEAKDPDGATLAELYAARAGDAPVTVEAEPAATSAYL